MYLIAALERQRPVDLCELKVSLIYIASCKQLELHGKTLLTMTTITMTTNNNKPKPEGKLLRINLIIICLLLLSLPLNHFFSILYRMRWAYRDYFLLCLILIF